MEKLVKGDIVIVPFPFSDLDETKKRPALIVATPKNDEAILCQITTKTRIEDEFVQLENSDFKSGSLDLSSMIILNMIFTLKKARILYKAGELKDSKMKEVAEEICKIFKK